MKLQTTFSLATLALSSATFAQSYVATSLAPGLSPEGLNLLSYPYTINDSGAVGGRMMVYDPQGPPAYDYPWHAFLWLPSAQYGLSAGLHDLGDCGGADICQLSAMNNLGVGVGHRRFPGLIYQPVLFIQNQVITDHFESPAGSSHVIPKGINMAGEAAGMVFDPVSGQFRGAYWDASGGLTILQPLPGFDHAEALDINDAGVIVGYGWNTFATMRAAVWTDPGAPPIVLAMSAPYNDACLATAINNMGEVAGRSVDGDINGGPSVPSLWSGPAALNYETLGGPMSSLYAISESGTAVGWSHDGQSIRAIVASRDASIIDLNGAASGWYSQLTQGMGVNAAGHIIAIGEVENTDGSISEQAFRLVPITPDINGDGMVGVLDLLLLIEDWGTSDPQSDLNFNGIVDVNDLQTVLQHWDA